METGIKKKVLNRLKRLEGQVRGLQQMVEKDTYCVDIITQSSAVRSALSSVENLMLENHLGEHVVHQIRGHQEKKAVQEILGVFRRAAKK
ncbi:MAG: metal-sensitive transcriptional regulator [Patescibacteria group bacterium]|nr:metal-sensitive transcriptional regulator [bacterium]MDZ4226927.1 metal-sensitive transcriptional regulator [Patescibacteria group bacterium]